MTEQSLDRLLAEVRDAADRYREADEDLQEAITLARDLGFTVAEIAEATGIPA